MIRTTLPNNIEAEESLLCYILIHNDMSEIIDLLDAKDFYKTANLNIYGAMQNLYNRKEPVELISVITELKSQQLLEISGGARYVAKLIDMPIALDPKYTAETIKACAIGRLLISRASDILNKAYDANRDNILELLNESRETISDISFNINISTALSYKELVNTAILDIEERSQLGIAPGIQTGFRTIDRLTGGFWGPLLIIIAARPGIGKTSFMLNMAKNMAKAGTKLSIYSLEMSSMALMKRQLANETGINLTKLRTGQGLTYEEFLRINEAEERLATLPIKVDDGFIPISELKRRIRIDVKTGAKIIFIDQLSKIPGGRGNSFFERFTDIVSQLAMLKKELNTPIVLLAQINRQSNDNIDKKPSLENLKQSGAIEEDADIVFLGYRKGYYTKLQEDAHHAEWELAKQRDGAPYNIKMYWEGKTTTFYELEENNL